MKRTVGLIATVLAAVLAGAPSAGATTVCAGADVPVGVLTLGSAKASVLCIVNAERTARGLPELQRSTLLATAAQLHTDDMVLKHYFAHESQGTGADPGDRITAAGYDWWQYGENIAVGQVTPREVMAGWLKSPGHCANIFSPGVTQLGVGISAIASIFPNQSGGTWTQDFARPAGTPPPSHDTSVADGCADHGYTSFAGLDPAPQKSPNGAVDETPGTPTPDDGSADPSSSGPGVPSGRTPDPGTVQAGTLERLQVLVMRGRSQITLTGRVLHPASSQRSRVRIVVYRNGRAVRRLSTRLSSAGTFAVRFSRPAARSLKVRVTVRGLRLTRTIR